jgi:alpha-L-fucosidase
MTCKPHRLYIHVLEDIEQVYLLNIANQPLAARLLATGAPLELTRRTTCEGDSSWRIRLPRIEPRPADRVICVETLEEWPVFEPIRD